MKKSSEDDSIRYMSKIVRELSKLIVRTMKEEGIGSGEIDLIHTVRHQPGISQKEIGQLLNMDKGAVARRVANLERKGYLVRKVKEEDKRSQYIYATEKADQLKNSKAMIEETFFTWLYEELPPSDYEEMKRIMDTLYLRSKKESRSGFPNVSLRLTQREGMESYEKE